MKYLTSLWNSTLIRHFMGQTFWIAVLYTVISLVTLPLSLWVASSNMGNVENVLGFENNNIVQTLMQVNLFFGIIFAVMLAIFTMNFKNRESISDFIHSLPVKRGSVLSAVYIVGILLITLPVLFISIILMFERYILVFDLSFGEIFFWMINTGIMMIITYILTVFTGFFTNKLFIHLQLIVILFFLPLAMWGAMLTTASMMYDGIAVYSSMRGADLLSPVINNTFPVFAITQNSDEFSLMKSIIWTVVGIVILSISYFLYMKRRNEYVNSNFTYSSVRYVLSVIITILGMLILGSVLGYVLSGNDVVKVISFVLGWLGSYIIVEMLFQSTVKIDIKLKAMIISAISAIIFMGVFYAGWNSYTSYVPVAESVNSVMVYSSDEGSSYTNFENKEIMSDDYLTNDNPEFINDTVEAHKYAAESSVEEVRPGYYRTFEVAYKMNDGSMVYRSFDHYPDSDEALQALQQLDSVQNLRTTDLILNIEEHEWMTNIMLSSFSGETVYINGEDDMNRFINNYKSAFQSSADGRLDLVDLSSQNLFNMEIEYHHTGNQREYIYGNGNLYNPAVIETISEEMRLSEFLALDEAERVYEYEVVNPDVFYNDFKNLPMETFNSRYELTLLEQGEREDIEEEIDAGNLSTDSGRAIMFSNPYYYPADNSNAQSAQYTHFIIGIE
ncbi:ABC transporter permease [Lacicoccus qingdaonensis]|uniref:ABC-2 type transport system permease protein n=1 Tax=Lacicoccus qingdaonensis TaxID=576118 RepID=A0A1G9DLN1_9BACL|nr:hypothetical protein [Salinicoccus qingdaonensis]SDK64796.1 ABC-2 type transport system permease protein [Salinicoccus qingdaonensis]